MIRYLPFTSDNHIIANPDSLSCSERTTDIDFFDICLDYDMQCLFNWATAVHIEPEYRWQEVRDNQTIIRNTASYLSQLQNDKELYDFLMTNPKLRVLKLKD
jgi:hypothetical protein